MSKIVEHFFGIFNFIKGKNILRNNFFSDRNKTNSLS